MNDGGPYGPGAQPWGSPLRADRGQGKVKLTAGQLQDQHRIKAGDGGDSEGFQALGYGGAGVADAVLHLPALALDQLQLD